MVRLHEQRDNQLWYGYMRDNQSWYVYMRETISCGTSIWETISRGTSTWERERISPGASTWERQPDMVRLHERQSDVVFLQERANQSWSFYKRELISRGLSSRELISRGLSTRERQPVRGLSTTGRKSVVVYAYKREPISRSTSAWERQSVVLCLLGSGYQSWYSTSTRERANQSWIVYKSHHPTRVDLQERKSVVICLQEKQSVVIRLQQSKSCFAYWTNQWLAKSSLQYNTPARHLCKEKPVW